MSVLATVFMIYHNISDDGYDGDDDDYNEVLICCIPTGDLKGVVGPHRLAVPLSLTAIVEKHYRRNAIRETCSTLLCYISWSSGYWVSTNPNIKERSSGWAIN